MTNPPTIRAMKLRILAALAISGCAHSRPIMGPDGTAHVNVTCPRSIENCYEEAAQACPSGYDVVDKNDNSALVPTSNGPMMARKFSMLIKCH